jgi:hypothetical protein
MSDEAEIMAVAKRAAEEAVRSTLLTLGIDVDDPIQAQQDFAVLREVGQLVRDPEFRKDIEHTRTWRLSLAAIKVHSAKAAITIIVGGVLGALWIGFKSYFPGGGQ